MSYFANLTEQGLQNNLPSRVMHWSRQSIGKGIGTQRRISQMPIPPSEMAGSDRQVRIFEDLSNGQHPINLRNADSRFGNVSECVSDGDS